MELADKFLPTSFLCTCVLSHMPYLAWGQLGGDDRKCGRSEEGAWQAGHELVWEVSANLVQCCAHHPVTGLPWREEAGEIPGELAVSLQGPGTLSGGSPLLPSLERALRREVTHGGCQSGGGSARGQDRSASP